MRQESHEGFIFKWRTIGVQLGVSPRTLQRWCAEADVQLLHWHNKKTEPVFIPEEQLGLLIKRLLRSRCRAKVVAAARRKNLPFLALLIRT